MSLNTAHLNGGVLIHNGEQILLYSDAVGIEWNGQQISSFQGVKKGSIYLTTHRVIFLNKSSGDEMLSFSFPFITLSEVDIEQPVFGANYIKGKVRAQPNGNWIGEAKFKITFKHGGAIEFGQAMLRAAHLASRGGMQAPPPYVPPQTQWYAAPPPAYAPPPQGYYGWSPPTNVFPQQPPSDGVFMTDAPPPYPGIIPGYQANGYGPPQGPPGPAAAGYGAYPQGYPQGGPPAYPGAPGGSAGYDTQGAGGFQQPQFTNAAGAMVPYRGGATNVNTAAQPYQIRAQPYQYRAQPFQYRSYQRPQFRNNPHWCFPPRRQDAKAHEAAQSAYYDPNRPQMAYVPPPAYYENPPTYNQATNKKQQ